MWTQRHLVFISVIFTAMLGFYFEGNTSLSVPSGCYLLLNQFLAVTFFSDWPEQLFMCVGMCGVLKSNSISSPPVRTRSTCLCSSRSIIFARITKRSWCTNKMNLISSLVDANLLWQTECAFDFHTFFFVAGRATGGLKVMSLTL